MTPREASVKVARHILTQWSEQEGCTVVSRYEGDRWDKLVDIIAAARDQQIEKDAILVETCHIGQWHEGGIDLVAVTKQNAAHAIRQQGAR